MEPHRNNLKGKISYLLSQGVRARKEHFGFLIYSSREAKLTFVGCGDLFDVMKDPGGRTRLVANDLDAGVRKKVKRVYEALRAKGFIDEAGTGVQPQP